MNQAFRTMKCNAGQNYLAQGKVRFAKAGVTHATYLLSVNFFRRSQVAIAVENSCYKKPRPRIYSNKLRGADLF